MKCETIFAHSSEHSVRKMCRVPGLKETVYNRWRKAEEKRRQRVEAERTDIKAVQKAFEENHRIYGCRRIKEALKQEGIELSEWKIRRIMRENGLYPEQLKKYRPGKSGRSDGKYCENIVQQRFDPKKPNEIWAASRI